jgi:hypothetical protein
MGRMIPEIALKYDSGLGHFVCAVLVDNMYAKWRAIHDAHQLFVKMPNKDLVTLSVMIGFARMLTVTVLISRRFC